jgi:hypothetical protein
MKNLNLNLLCGKFYFHDVIVSNVLRNCEKNKYTYVTLNSQKGGYTGLPYIC